MVLYVFWKTVGTVNFKMACNLQLDFAWHFLENFACRFWICFIGWFGCFSVRWSSLEDGLACNFCNCIFVILRIVYLVICHCRTTGSVICHFRMAKSVIFYCRMAVFVICHCRMVGSVISSFMRRLQHGQLIWPQWHWNKVNQNESIK